MSLTCITCKVLFSDPENHREHYKSEWHRYNLKRKVAELPSITKEEFEEKVKIYQLPSEDNIVKVSKCEKCRKFFSSDNALENHLKSKRHLSFLISDQNKKHSKPTSVNRVEPYDKTEELIGEACGKIKDDLSSTGEVEICDSDDGWESCDEDDETCDPVNCLFCLKASPTFRQNVEHMSASHFFFIPYVEYLSDLKGLISYLHGKVYDDHVCLWCNEKGKFFKSTMAAQMHMVEKQHCKMLYEDESIFEYESFYDYSSIHTDSEEEDEVEILDGGDYELVLPSGKTIGHRSLAIYYRQNLRPYKPENGKRIKKLVQHYQALGWTGTSGEKAKQRARDMNKFRRQQNRQFMRLGVKANKLQTHFRMQVMF